MSPLNIAILSKKACSDVNKYKFLGSGIYGANLRSVLNPLSVNPTKWLNTLKKFKSSLATADELFEHV